MASDPARVEDVYCEVLKSVIEAVFINRLRTQSGL
jgi:hypothetical protein